MCIFFYFMLKQSRSGFRLSQQMLYDETFYLAFYSNQFDNTFINAHLAMYLIWRMDTTAKGVKKNTLPNAIHLQYLFSLVNNTDITWLTDFKLILAKGSSVLFWS